MGRVGLSLWLTVGLLNVLLFQNCGKLDDVKAGAFVSETAIPLEAETENAEVEEQAEFPLETPTELPSASIAGTNELRGNRLVDPGLEVGESTVYSLPQSSEGLVVTFEGYDIDNAREVDIYADGQRVGLAPAGLNNDFSGPIKALLPIGAQSLEFRQALDPAFRWGVVILSTEWASQVTVPKTALADVSAVAGQTSASLTYTILDANGEPEALPSLIQYRVKGQAEWVDRSVAEHSYNFSTHTQALASRSDEVPLVPDTDYEWRVLVGLEKSPSENIYSFRTLP